MFGSNAEEPNAKERIMATVESSPEMALRIYRRMNHNLNIVRRRLRNPLTLSDKLLLGHLDDPESQDIEPGRSQLRLRPDRVLFQDVLGQTGMLQFMQTGRKTVAVPTTVAPFFPSASKIA